MSQQESGSPPHSFLCYVYQGLFPCGVEPADPVWCCVLPTIPQGINLWHAFGWEVLMTFLLVVTVYSVAVGEPSFGIMGPLVIGAAVYAAAITGGGFTGAALNPARVLGECARLAGWLAAVSYGLPSCLAGWLPV